MTRENAPCKNRCLIKAGLAIGFVMAGGLGRAETTRELRDGKYWIDVPQGETYTLAESDVDVLVPDEGAQPELWKIGPGTLEMTTNGLANCAKMMSYNADIYATNGLLRTLSEYALGNYTKNTTTEKSTTRRTRRPRRARPSSGPAPPTTTDTSATSRRRAARPLASPSAR